MSGWTRKALEAALGARYTDHTEDLPHTAGQRLRTLTWGCDGSTIVASKTLSAEYYTIEVGCSHRAHQELAQYPLVRLTEAVLLDASGTRIETLPRDASGYRFRFTLDGPMLQYAPIVRVESSPDLEGPGLDLVEEWRVGEYAPGATHEVPLQGNAHRDRELSVHIIDPQRASRDWGDHGVKVWARRVAVE
jgi:hypothetical protein